MGPSRCGTTFLVAFQCLRATQGPSHISGLKQCPGNTWTASQDLRKNPAQEILPSHCRRLGVGGQGHHEEGGQDCPVASEGLSGAAPLREGCLAVSQDCGVGGSGCCSVFLGLYGPNCSGRAVWLLSTHCLGPKSMSFSWKSPRFLPSKFSLSGPHI